jgi:hypothetical protein
MFRFNYSSHNFNRIFRLTGHAFTAVSRNTIRVIDIIHHFSLKCLFPTDLFKDSCDYSYQFHGASASIDVCHL